MRKVVCAIIGFGIVFFSIVSAQAETPFATVRQVDKAHKVILISGQIGDRLQVGDKVYVKAGEESIELVVTFPMMSVAKCRIPPTSDQSAFNRVVPGQEVFLKKPGGSVVSKAIPAELIAGSWKEYWAPGQETDVNYNDIYDIKVESGRITVTPKKDEGYPVKDVRFEKDTLSFTQVTSFEVKYSLKINPDGKVFNGTAVTPKGTFPIKWERTADNDTPVLADGKVTGVWKEFWAPGQETDVNYNDIYSIVEQGGSLKVILKDTDGSNIRDISYVRGLLKFTQKTAFDVKYQLKLSADGTKLEGTATTPSKTVPIRWEKQSDRADARRPAGDAAGIGALAGKWKEFWAPGQETDVNYNDIYIISVSGSTADVRLEKDTTDTVTGEVFSGGEISFTQKTAFEVKYKLKISPDGSKLEGTATTPNKTVPIRWERQ